MGPDLYEGALVKVSAASARLLFTQCGPACNAANACGGKCCDAPGRPGGCLVTIHASERQAITACGGTVDGDFLAPAPGGGCPFKAGGLCTLHDTGHKPFGCIASPFTLNRAATLIVRNRYKCLPCYRGQGPKAPAYRTFAASLRLLFGQAQAARITAHLDDGGGDITAPMPLAHYQILDANDAAKARQKAPPYA
jgi:hypothetical protein